MINKYMTPEEFNLLIKPESNYGESKARTGKASNEYAKLYQDYQDLKQITRVWIVFYPSNEGFVVSGVFSNYHTACKVADDFQKWTGTVYVVTGYTVDTTVDKPITK